MLSSNTMQIVASAVLNIAQTSGSVQQYGDTSAPRGHSAHHSVWDLSLHERT